eukprot:tig00000507_g1783.t1
MNAFAVALTPAGLRQSVDINAREHLGKSVQAAPAAQQASFEISAKLKFSKTTGSAKDIKATGRAGKSTSVVRRFVSVAQKNSIDFELASLTTEGKPAKVIGVATTGASIPLLKYAPTCQNSRVAGFERITTDAPTRFNTAEQPTVAERDAMIWAAYNQIMNVHHLAADRQVELETRVRDGRITVKEFVKGLATSPAFLATNFDTNSNYRFVEIAVQRILGRDVYSQAEKIAWSIVIANKGVHGFIDALVESDEYKANFGEHTVPFQRQRVLAGRATGETPFLMKTPRYGADYRAKQPFSVFSSVAPRRAFSASGSQSAGNPLAWLNVAKSVAVQPNKQPSWAVSQGWESKVPKRA